MALRFFALYVASLLIGLLTWAGVLGGGVAFLLVALGGFAVVAARAFGRRTGRSLDDGG